MKLEKQGRERERREMLDRGSVLFKNGDYEPARALFEKAVELEPHCAEAHAWLAAVYGRRIDAAWNLTEKLKLLSHL